MVHDEQAAQDALLPEERRFKKDNQMLESLNMDKLMSVAISNKKSVEYQASDDPFAINQSQLVSIKPKSKKKRPGQAKKAKLQAEEREVEIQALLAQPDQSAVVERAAELASESRLQAKDVSANEMAKL